MAPLVDGPLNPVLWPVSSFFRGLPLASCYVARGERTRRNWTWVQHHISNCLLPLKFNQKVGCLQSLKFTITMALVYKMRA